MPIRDKFVSTKYKCYTVIDLFLLCPLGFIMAEYGETTEAVLFRKYSSDFKRAMINPIEVADDLYSSRIIDEITRNKIKHHRNASDLVDAIESYVSSQTKRGMKLVIKFEKVLNILKKYIPLDSIVESLENEYYGMLSAFIIRVYIIYFS